MKRFLVIINGLGGVGKSEFIDRCLFCSFHTKEKTMIEECSIVDFVKRIACGCGWKWTKEAKDRVFLSDLKKALEKWNDIPYEKTIEEIDKIWNFMECHGCKYGVIFVNSREEKDIERFYKDASIYGATPIKLYVSSSRIKVNEVPDLIEEINRFANKSDYHIKNDGSISELEKSAEQFMKDVIGVEFDV